MVLVYAAAFQGPATGSLHLGGRNRVDDLGFRILASRFRVQYVRNLGFAFWGSGFWGLGFWVPHKLQIVESK